MLDKESHCKKNLISEDITLSQLVCMPIYRSDDQQGIACCAGDTYIFAAYEKVGIRNIPNNK